MNLIEETRKAFEEYLAVACDGLSRRNSFTEESVKALKHSLQGKTEVLRATLYGKNTFALYRGSGIEGF
jgi:hypothetical protein